MMENIGYDLTKRSGLNVDKEIRTLLRSFVLKGKAPDTTTRFEEDWAMCPPQYHQILNLKNHYIKTTCQARHRGSQMSVLVLSLEIFQ